MKKVDTPFIRPPQRKSGKSEPTLVRLIGREMITGPLNDRLQQHIQRLKFPTQSLTGSFQIEQQGEDLHFRFSVNGETEAFVFYQWRKVHSDLSIEQIRVLPWKLFNKAFYLLDQGHIIRRTMDDQDSAVYAYPENMRPATGSAHDFTYFPVFYWLVLPAWQHGKHVYKKNRQFSTWRETVKREISDKLAGSPCASECLPDDESSVFDALVERFEKATNRDETITQQKILRDRKMPAAAAELALDYAAHLCGARLYEYSIRHLKTLKSGRVRDSKRIAPLRIV